MAEITLTLLTPISIRLSWAGSGDFEVWWKSDHPAGQEYVPLATVTGTSYDVGSLSWTTTYYFKVRQVGGAFGTAVEVFVCCGSAYVIEPPPSTNESPPSTDSPGTNPAWQQSIDIQDGKVVLVTPYADIKIVRYYLVDVNGRWNLVKTFDVDTLVGMPYDVIMLNKASDTFVYITFPLKAVLLSILFSQSFITSWEAWGAGLGGGAGIMKNVCANSSGRVVVCLQDYVLFLDLEEESEWWASTLNLAISRDFGMSFESPIMISDNNGNGWDTGAYMAEDNDGALWFLTFYTSESVTTAAIYKYTEGGTFDLMRTITGDHQYGNRSAYNSLDIDGDIIVATYIQYNNSVSKQPYIEISTDGGATWAHKAIGLVNAGQYPGYCGPTAVSGTNLITYGDNYTTGHYCLKLSTDYGDTWAEVVDLSTYHFGDLGYSFVRADGTDVVFTGCGFTDVVGGDIGYLRSSDSGATWTYVDASGTIWGPL